MRRLFYLGLALGLAGGILLAGSARVGAQMTGGMSSGLSGGLGSSGMGSSFGGPGMSGSGGMTGSTMSGGMTGGMTGGIAGGTTGVGFGGAGGSTGGLRSGGMTGTYGSTALWGSYLAAPYAMGLQAPGWGNRSGLASPQLGQALRFGTPVYSTTNTTGMSTGMGGSASMGMTNRGAFASSIGIRRSLPFMVDTGLGSGPAPANVPLTGPLQARPDLQAVLERSSRLSSRDTIQVGMVGPVVVLRGTVLNEHDRRLAEGLIRLSPGVHEIRNELAIQGMTAARP
jgi:hypothetical protein